MASTPTVAGIDVGADKKLCNLVILREASVIASLARVAPEDLPAICRDHDVLVAAVDAPSRWRGGELARQAERDMARAGVSSFSTPTLRQAQRSESGFFDWMFFGMRVYAALASEYPLLETPHHAGGRACFETFPHAITCALLGVDVASAKLKSTQRKALLETFKIDTSALTSVDARDAALCALTAQFLLKRQTRTYGDADGGHIHVPDIKPGPAAKSAA